MARALYKVVGAGGAATGLRPFTSGADLSFTPTRDALVYGTYKPSASTTGLLPGTTMGAYTGTVTLTSGGTPAAPVVYENMDIVGRLVLRAPNIVVRNVRVTYDGTAYSTNVGLIDCTNTACANITITDCEVNGKSPTGLASLWLDGIKGRGFAAYRNNIHHVVDGGGWSSDGITFVGNWVHDLAGFLVDPNHANGPTHNDCVQPQGGNNHRIYGNNLSCNIATDVADGAVWAEQGGWGGQWGNACIQTNRATTNITNGWVIERNWADNGKILFNLAGNGAWATSNPTAAPPVFDSVSYNRFGHNSAAGSGGYNDTYTILYAPTTTVLQALGDVYDDNNVPVHIRNTGAA